MKKIKIFLLALVVVFCFQVSAGMAPEAAQVQAAASQKSGLVKVKKKYFYYKKGKKVKNKWVNVKIKGKTKRYYFGKTGAACTGVKKIKGNVYCFNAKAQMLKSSWYKKTYYLGEDGKAYTGIWTVDGKLYAFAGNGKKDAAKTELLQKCSVQGTDLAELKKLIGEPDAADYMASCMTWENQSGDDGILTYKNFTVYTFRYGEKEIVWSVFGNSY